MESIEQTLDRLESIYDAAVERLRADVIAFGRERELPTPERRRHGRYSYPHLRLRFRGGDQPEDRNRAFGRLNAPGLYTTTVTRPALFRDYLREQLELIDENYEVELEVGSSRQEIPFPYVLDGEAGAELVGVDPNLIARHFPSTELADIGDELADGIILGEPDEAIPLSLFDGLRTDFSLARLAHYTGTSTEHFQRFILFTNYHRYVDEFVDWAGSQLGANGYTALAGAGGLMLTEKTDNARAQLSDTAWRRHQMPAYHLVGPNKEGITLVNIGVGPSNAKTICDHLAVLRPEAWLMIGHCGGLRPSQKIGDYVLAHAYLRDDHVLDPVLPPAIPLPAIAEVQHALAGAFARAVAQSCVHPLNVAKTTLQTANGPAALRAMTSGGLFSMATWRHLSRGLGAQALLSMPNGAINFCVMEGTRRFICSVAPRGGALIDATTAAAGTAVATVVSLPQSILNDRIMGGALQHLVEA